MRQASVESGQEGVEAVALGEDVGNLLLVEVGDQLGEGVGNLLLGDFGDQLGECVGRCLLFQIDVFYDLLEVTGEVESGEAVLRLFGGSPGGFLGYGGFGGFVASDGVVEAAAYCDLVLGGSALKIAAKKNLIKGKKDQRLIS